MESCTPWLGLAPWSPPAWLENTFLPDARFARAYEALAANRRALIKGLVARHFVLNQPGACPSIRMEERYPLFSRRRETSPVPLVILLNDGSLDAPALFLAALLPALCAGVGQVLALRLGTKHSVPDSLLVSCELAGQERLAALGPRQLQNLLLDCAGSAGPAVLLYPQTEVLRPLLEQKALRAALDASALRRMPLTLPRAPGLWRDAPGQFPANELDLLYGQLVFEEGGAAPNGLAQPAETAWNTFCAVPRDLLLVPNSRLEQISAGCAVRSVCAEGCVGHWTWPEILPGLFSMERETVLTTP